MTVIESTNTDFARRIEQACIHAEELRSKSQWTQVEVICDNVYLKYGAIHSNGQHEIAIARRSYFIKFHKVDWHTHVHV